MSNNTAQKGSFKFLIIPNNTGGFLGMCKEAGFIEEGKTIKEVEERLLNGVVALLKTVHDHPEYEPSLNLGLPLKYRFLFYKAVLQVTVFSFFKRQEPFELFVRERNSFACV